MPKIISIEGNIGSGKSTFLSYLKEYYQNSEIIFLKEPVDEWENIKDAITNETMLEKFYADQPRYSFPFQVMAFITRLSALKEAIDANPDAIIITERCLYTDKLVFAKMLYDIKYIEDVNYQIYCMLFEKFVKDVPLHEIIYIRADPMICYERIQRRSRQGEMTITLEYLEKCHQYHEEMMNALNVTVRILDGNVDIQKNHKMAIDEEVTHQIIQGL